MHESLCDVHKLHTMFYGEICKASISYFEREKAFSCLTFSPSLSGCCPVANKRDNMTPTELLVQYDGLTCFWPATIAGMHLTWKVPHAEVAPRVTELALFF